jgi:hypothetical protein
MIFAVNKVLLPESALPRRYAGHYTDCYASSIAIETCMPDYVEAFYTTTLFKAERVVLARVASLPSTDEEARQVSRGDRDTFAAWNVEARTDDQLLLLDFRRRTGSWFMCERHSSGTTLYFGSVIFLAEEGAAGRRMSAGYRALLGFHRLYSRALLSAARSRLLSSGVAGK